MRKLCDVPLSQLDSSAAAFTSGSVKKCRYYIINLIVNAKEISMFCISTK